MHRELMLLAILGLTPLLMGAGGQAPPPDVVTRTVGPTLPGTLVIDPHEPTVTSSARLATLVLRKGADSASAVFVAQGTYQCGCDLALSTLRLLGETPSVGKPLETFVPQATIAALLAEIGVEVPVSKSGAPGVAIVTAFASDTCTGDLDANGTLVLVGPEDACTVDGATPRADDKAIAGTFSVEIVVQFRIPKE